MTETPKTLIEAVRCFSDLDVCEAYMRELRWHGGPPVCEHCGSDRIGEIKTMRLLRCKDCRKKLYTKKGTIFEDSPLGLDKWFVAIWAIANCKNGVSSHELARTLGINQKSAWFMLHRIRCAMQTDEFGKFDGGQPKPTGTRHSRVRPPVHGVLQRSDLVNPSQSQSDCAGPRGRGRAARATFTGTSGAVGRSTPTDARTYGDLVRTHAHAGHRSFARIRGPGPHERP